MATQKCEEGDRMQATWASNLATYGSGCACYIIPSKLRRPASQTLEVTPSRSLRHSWSRAPVPTRGTAEALHTKMGNQCASSSSLLLGRLNRSQRTYSGLLT